MEIGFVGLGRMGGNMALRLLKRGHRVVAFDLSAEAVKRHAAEGAVGASTWEAFVGGFEDRPRIMWIMVHNGVEYGIMQAYAEGFQVMKMSRSFPGMDMRAIAEAWRTGSVVRSWLLDLIARGLSQDPELTSIKGWVEDTGEGRWTVEAAIDESVPTPVIAESLFARFRSRMENTFGDRMLAMMRAQFGGHAAVSDAKAEAAVKQ